jgi:hypothetical protein
MAVIGLGVGDFVGSHRQNVGARFGPERNDYRMEVVDDKRTLAKRSNTPRNNSSATGPRAGESYKLVTLSPDDVALTKDLDQRRARGEFILKNERPLMRRSQERHFALIAARAFTNNAAEYARVFGEFGISSDISTELQLHLSKIERASVEAENSITQVLDARLRYDQRIRSLLSQDGYARYREYEELKPAFHEVGNIQLFLRKCNGIPLRADSELSLARLLTQAKLIENSWWHGPYSPLPQPRLGWEQVIARAEMQFEQVTECANIVAKRISELGLTPEQEGCVAGYYREKLRQKQMAVEELKHRYSDSARPEAASGKHDGLALPATVRLENAGK